MIRRMTVGILVAVILFALARPVWNVGSEYRAVEGDRSAGSSGGPSSGTIPPAASSPVTALLPSAPTGESSRPFGSPTTYDEPERAKAVTPAVAGEDSEPSPGRITSPEPTSTRAAASVEPDTAITLSGIASWFDSPGGVSAAGPVLRRELGPGWRGTVVTVCADTCIETVLGDWCACPKRLIDLHAPIFAALAPLSKGLLRVEVRG